IRRFALLSAVASGQYEHWKSFADSCMAEYDLDGWTVPDLVNPDDVSALRKAWRPAERAGVRGSEDTRQ
ncbi:MAG TPA: hypothetical protein VH230_16700, partial [Stellaceae bacterium]|nr:hypothetical protein [Stellaceae bacterium]